MSAAEGIVLNPEAIVRLFPHTFAEFASGGRWIPYDYLVEISKAITRAIYSGRGRVIVSIPPRHGKSELISKWLPSWRIATDPTARVMLSSYEADFASAWGRKVREFFESPRGRAITGVQVKGHSSAADRWETTEGGGMQTAGIGGAFTGKGGDLLIVDDPVKNWIEASSAHRRKLIWEWFLSTFYTRAEPGACIVVLMTRWHEDDLAGKLLKEHADDWIEVKMPALGPGDVALCPTRYSSSDLLAIKKSIGTFMFGSIYQQNPVPLDGGVFKRHWFRHWTPATLPEKFDEIIQSWDMPFDENEKGTSSYIAGQVWARVGADRYLLAEYHEQGDFPEMKRAVIKLSEDYPDARTKVIENKAAGAPLIKDLKAKVPGLVPFNPKGSKEARAISVSGEVESGNVYLPHPSVCPWVRDFLDEVCTFPKADLKDRVDAMVQALLRFGKTKVGGKMSFGSLTRVSPTTGA